MTKDYFKTRWFYHDLSVAMSFCWFAYDKSLMAFCVFLVFLISLVSMHSFKGQR
jgi:hypothetical protein